jgi:hypothetical protein
MAVKGPRRTEPLTIGDRLVAGFLGGLFAFGTMLVVWFLVLNAGGRTGNDVSLPFIWVWGVTGAVAALSFVAGPERMVDGFEAVWGVFGRIFFRRARR